MLQTRGNISTWCVFIKWCEVNKGAQHRDLPEELDWLVSRSSTLRVSCDAVKKTNFSQNWNHETRDTVVYDSNNIKFYNEK